MTDDTTIPSEEELEESYSDSSQYTVQLNGSEYELNEAARRAIETRAENEFEQNKMFECFWKEADPSQYDVDEWSARIHEKGDPVLVISTSGVMVPWERMDSLNVEMQDAGEHTGMGEDGSRAGERDNGNGVRTIDPEDLDGPSDDTERTIGRTHFSLTPQSFEEVPSPDGEESDKVPPKPAEMGDEPAMVAWIPEYPGLEHTWGAGEAVCPMYNRVEWNVQVKADQPQLAKKKSDSHDHWEALLDYYDCDVVAELAVSQQPTNGGTATSADAEPSEQDDDVPEHFKSGKYGGGNWQV